jgi:integral membrane protein (TIGR01906 family)
MRCLLRWILVLAVPVVLVMGVVRGVTMPWYPAWAYRRPDFPPDPGGMAPEERLRLARACIAYLNVPGPPRDAMLAALTLPDGTPAFDAREIRHMADVKRVYNGLTLAAGVALVLGVGAAWLLHRRHGASSVWRALSLGGALTLLLLVTLGLWMLVGFEAFFTAFHGVFFQGDTWLFAYTDTLIRLFPLRFWRDAGLLIVGVVGAAALGLALGGHVLSRRQVGVRRGIEA